MATSVNIEAASNILYNFSIFSTAVYIEILGRFRILDASLASSLVCDHRARDASLFAHARVE